MSKRLFDFRNIKVVLHDDESTIQISVRNDGDVCMTSLNMMIGEDREKLRELIWELQKVVHSDQNTRANQLNDEEFR